MLNLTEFIKIHLNPIWEAIKDPKNEADLGGNETRNFLNKLKAAKFKSGDDSFSNSANKQDYLELIEGNSSPQQEMELSAFLNQLEPYRDSLEAAQLAYDSTNPDSISDWPSEFLLCGRNVRGILKDLKDSNTRDEKTNVLLKREDGLIRRALAEVLQQKSPNRIPLVPLASKLSKSADQEYSETSDGVDRFIIRCIFECPNCPPSLSQVVSKSTIKFQMASYFDPDAPARPIQIPLPVDTTPAGLRKFTKNTMFAISDSLACQIELARKLTFGDLVLSVLPWPFHKNLPDPRAGKCKEKGIDIGKLCTLSIPIITICALILLIIIVLLLDQIFKWVPYLIYCLPLPGLKAKKGEKS